MGEKHKYEIVSQLSLSKVAENYIIFHDRKTYKVGMVLYSFITNLKLYNLENALKTVAKEFSLNENEKEILINNLYSFIDSLEAKKKRKSYIFLKFTLFNQKITNLISNKLKNIFFPSILYLALPISFILSIVFIIVNQSLLFRKIDLTIIELCVCFLSIVTILLAHEFGHSSASKFFSVDPKEIGFGIYLFFPVFYSNVSAIWGLQKKKRIVVNIGGVYFQLLFNLLLIGLYYLFQNYHFHKISLTLIKVNSIVILYSLLPFTRNDGYWIYSDFYEIPNLNIEANKYPVIFLKRLFKKTGKYYTNSKEKWIAFYSIGNYFFIGIIVSSFFPFMTTLIDNLKGLYPSIKSISDVNKLIPYLGSMLIAGIFFFFAIKQFIGWSKLIFIEINKIK